MSRFQGGITVVAVALGVALAGPSWAADPPKAGGASQITPMRQAASPCPAGWTLLPGGTKDNFFCAPPKIKLKCPPDTRQVEKNCAVGCEPVIK